MWKKIFGSASSGKGRGGAADPGRLQDFLGPSGRVQYKVLKRKAAGLSKDDFLSFFPVPALLGSRIHSGKIEDAKGLRRKTLLFMRSSELMKDANEMSALKEAVFPLLKQKGSKPGDELNYTIGSQGAVDIIMGDFAVSKRHAAISIRRRGYGLRDLGSTNGTRLNGVEVAKSEKILKDGDSISFGRYEFIFLTPESLYKHLRKDS